MPEPVSDTEISTYWPAGNQHVRRLDRELAAFRHGVARVDREVEDGGLDLVGIGFGLPQARALHSLHGNTLSERPLQQFRETEHQPAGVNRLRLERLPARESQQALGQRGGALRASDHVRDGTLEMAVPRLHSSLQDVEISEDDLQQIVEVVGDPAGQLAQSLHPLRLA
jgi:hypothetical protein